MRYNIYCDEASTTVARYMLIGGLWVPWNSETELHNRFAQVRSIHNLTAEMKWTKVSIGKLRAYQDFLNVFWTDPNLSFKCIVVDTHILNYHQFHGGDHELGFYKFYYQLISRNLLPNNLYWLYTDERHNRKPYRLSTLKATTNAYWKKRSGQAPLRVVEPRPSDNEDCIQLADLLLGAISYAWNEHAGSPAKLAMVDYIARCLNRPTLRIATRPSASKVNIWVWRPSEESLRKSKTRPSS